MPETTLINAPTRKSLRNVHYAILQSDTIDGVVYGAPAPLVGAITATIKPTTNSETLHADDGPIDVANGLGEIALDMALAVLPLQKQAILLGHTYNNGVMVKKATDEPPYVAIGFMSQERDGRIQFVWLYKGKFHLLEDAYETSSDTPAWKQPSMTGTFVKRIHDDAWEIVANTADPAFAGTADTWFDEVFEQEDQGGTP